MKRRARNIGMKSSLLFSILLTFSATMTAQDRELATHGDAIKFSMDSDYQCAEEATINISTTRADKFELEDEIIQTWSDAIKDILGYECDGQIETIKFKGFTDGVEIFTADTNADVKWSIQSAPAPLEQYALFFNLREPDLFNFGALYSLYKPFDAIPGIKETIQYEILKEQLVRLSEAVDGDMEGFQSYLQSAGPGLPNFETVKHHLDVLMEAIQAIKPDQYDNYLMTYLTNLQNLKQNFWTAQASEIFDDYSLSLAQLFVKATEKAELSESDEFTQFMDKQLVEVVNDEFNILKDEIGEATLLDVNYAADFLAEAPDTESTKLFPGASALLGIYPDQLVIQLNQRMEELTTLAKETIDASGQGHIDTDTVMETGFALAGEFGDSGFEDESEQLVIHTIEKINSELASDLPEFKKGILELELDDQIATELQSQSNIYQELTSQFEGFAEYQKIVDLKLIEDRDQICESLLVNASVDKGFYNQPIRNLDETRTLVDIACELYDNDHTLVSFNQSKKKGPWSLVIVQDDTNESKFVLTSVQGSDEALSPVSAVVSDTEFNEPERAQEELLRLIEQPANGLPDSNGIRQCDRLAGDAEDPNKLVTGMDFNDEALDPREFDRALDACIAAVENAPSDPRQQYQLGRVLMFAGDDENARDYIELSAQQSYAAALHHKAENLLTSSGEHNDFVDALSWFEQAGKAGYQPSIAMLKDLNPEGETFYKEIAGPTERDMGSIFTKRNCVNGGMLFTMCAKQRGARVRNCMQTSATDFECEYRVNIQCENGNNIFQNMAAGACRNAVVDWKFGRFRTGSSGWSLEEVLF